MEKWLVPGLGQEINKMSLDHLDTLHREKTARD